MEQGAGSREPLVRPSQEGAAEAHRLLPAACSLPPRLLHERSARTCSLARSSTSACAARAASSTCDAAGHAGAHADTCIYMHICMYTHTRVHACACTYMHSCHTHSYALARLNTASCRMGL